MTVPKLKVEKLSDLDFTIQCVSCGETKDIQMWPHRNAEGRMVGFLFFCAKCSRVAPGVICKFEYPISNASAATDHYISPKFQSSGEKLRKA